MASPLGDLWQKVMDTVNPPAVMTNTNLPTAGRYSPEGPIHRMASSVGLVHPGGTIQVNPNNTANLDTTIHHEKVHALLNDLDDKGILDKLNASNPYFKAMASKITLEPGTSASTEAPAYAATGEATQFGIDPKVTKQYSQYLQQQLHSVDPVVAKEYGALSQ